MKDIRNIITVSPEVTRLLQYTPRDAYFAMDGMNPSSLAVGLVGTNDINPCAVKLAWESPDAVPRTMAQQDSLDRGTVAHLMVLQPELLLDRVAVWRGGRRAGNEYNDFEIDNQGKLLLTAADYTRVATATNAMRSISPVAKLICGLSYEVAMLGTEKCKLLDDHLRVKGQVDGVNIATKTIVDLKTTEAGIDQRSVERTIRTFHYREKMAMYRRWIARATETGTDGWKCYNIFMSLREPFGVVIVKFTGDSLDWGAERMLTSLGAVEQCLAANEWPMYCREMFMNIEPWECDEDNGDLDYDT